MARERSRAGASSRSERRGHRATENAMFPRAAGNFPLSKCPLRASEALQQLAADRRLPGFEIHQLISQMV